MESMTYDVAVLDRCGRRRYRLAIDVYPSTLYGAFLDALVRLRSTALARALQRT